MEEFVARTRPGLLQAVRHIGDGEDAVQAAYLALLRRGRQAWRGSVYAWLYTTAVRAAYRRRAKRQRDEVIARRLSEAQANGDDNDDIDRERVRIEVARLPAKYRDPIILHHLTGLTTGEVAHILNIDPTTVRTRLHRARALLRGRLHPRIAHGWFALPWLLRDSGAATIGVIAMSKRATIVALMLFVLLAGVAWKLSPDRRPAAAKRSDATRSEVPQGRPEPEQPAKSEDDTAAPAGRPFARGEVVDTAGTPLDGVRVVCTAGPFRPLDDSAVVASTDPTGRFFLARRPPQSEFLYFVKPGYEPARERFAPKMRVVLSPGRTVECVVKDTDGQPVPTAVIHCFVPGRNAVHQRVDTDENGRAVLKSVPVSDQVRVAPSSFGYGPDMRTDLQPHMEFTLKRIGLIVDVSDATTGMLIKNAYVVFVQQGATPPVRVPVNPELFSSQGARGMPGRFFNTFFADDATQQEMIVDVHASAAGYRPFEGRTTWQLADQPPHLRVRLQKGRASPALSGRIVGPRHAHVLLRLRTSFAGATDTSPLFRIGTTTTDDRGRFGFAGLPNGAYRLAITADGFGAAGVDVDVPTDPLTIELKPSATLSLQARDGEGRPVRGAWFHVQTAGRTRFWEAQADKEGHVTIPGLPAGPLDVMPLRNDNIVSERYEGPRVRVKLRPGQEKQLEVRVPVRRPITVVLRDASGNALAGRPVSFHPVGGYIVFWHYKWRGNLEGKTDERGRVSLGVLPGLYEVVAVNGTARLRKRVIIDEAEPRMIELVAGPSALVRGRVLDRDTRRPVLGSTVRARDGTAQTTVDALGRFALSGLRGATILDVLVPSNGHHAPAWRKLRIPATGDVLVEFLLPQLHGPTARTSPFLVTVRDATDSRPLAQVVLALQGVSGKTVYRLGSWYSDARGRWSIKTPRMDEYIIKIWSSTAGYEGRELRVKSLASLEIELGRAK